jgi:hypothetical protein
VSEVDGELVPELSGTQPRTAGDLQVPMTPEQDVNQVQPKVEAVPPARAAL